MIPEVYISVDVETAGPIPSRYALLSIGACLMDNLSTSFYVELKPDQVEMVPEAIAISGLDLDVLRQTGDAPQAAMQAFADWVRLVTPSGQRAVFVALNAPFDWMFINDYFYRYLGDNPFGHSALDIKAYFMGATGCAWSETSFNNIAASLNQQNDLLHNALRDAQDQAAIFRQILHRDFTE